MEAISINPYISQEEVTEASCQHTSLNSPLSPERIVLLASIVLFEVLAVVSGIERGEELVQLFLVELVGGEEELLPGSGEEWGEVGIVEVFTLELDGSDHSIIIVVLNKGWVTVSC